MFDVQRLFARFVLRVESSPNIKKAGLIISAPRNELLPGLIVRFVLNPPFPRLPPCPTWLPAPDDPVQPSYGLREPLPDFLEMPNCPVVGRRDVECKEIPA